MVKKTILAIVAIFLLAVAFVGANHFYYTKRYGGGYYGYPLETRYFHYPVYSYPYGTYHPYQYASYTAPPMYTYPYNPDAGVRYGPVSYQSVPLPRGAEHQLCGSIDGQQYSCVYGLVCDYTKTNVVGVGVCSRQTYTTTYPWQVAESPINPYYYR